MADTPVCTGGTTWCTIVRDVTHNDGLARAADWLIGRPVSIVALIVLGCVVRWVLHRLIDRLVRRAAEGTVPGVLARNGLPHLRLAADESATLRRQQRAQTMASLLKSVTTAVISTIVAFMAVAQLGYDIAPLIASAGIIGVALGFGAQSLVKDFLSGIFLILEDQYGVGDLVNVGAATGVIEAVGLRVTRLRDTGGTVWYVRNGEILAVGNLSQGWTRIVVDVPVRGGADRAQARTLLADVAAELSRDAERSSSGPQSAAAAVEEPASSDSPVRLVVRADIDRSAAVADDVQDRIRTRFAQAGMEIPSPGLSVRQAPATTRGDPPDER